MSSVTRPTIPNFDIQSVFESYGYSPSQEEIDALAPAFGVGRDAGPTGISAIANYVQAHKELKGSQSQIEGNLLSEKQAAATSQSLADTLRTKGMDAYQQAANVFTKAPQLFGSMTPDQIDQYLSPLKTQFDYATGATESAMGQRGLVGSSLEAQAQDTAANQFKSSVLSQGLTVGMNQQQLHAAALQALGSGNVSLAQNLYGLAAQYSGMANNSAGQGVGVAEDLAQLPGAAVNQAIGQRGVLNAMNPDTSRGMLAGGLGAGLGFLVGGPLGANIGGNIASAATGTPGGAQLGGAINPLSGLLGMNQSGNYGGNNAAMLMNLLGKTPTGASTTAAGASGAGAAGATSGLEAGGPTALAALA